MKWTKYRIETTVEAEELICAALVDLGIEGFEIEDNQPLTKEELEAMFVDIGPEIPQDNGLAFISFYIEEENDKSILEEVKKQLEELRNFVDVGVATIEDSTTADVDWINNWKKYFHQFTIDDILVIPSWEDIKPEHSRKMEIRIDPGTAFGTGMHDTTQLCIRQIKKYIKENEKILDIGCGSGILGMLALKFGASYSLGTDLDPCAIEATHENMSVNQLPVDSYKVIAGNIIDNKEIQDQVGYETYEIVVANILTEVLLPLVPVALQCLKEGGIFITSGIINCNGKEELLSKTLLENGFEILETTYQGEWVSITARKG